MNYSSKRKLGAVSEIGEIVKSKGTTRRDPPEKGKAAALEALERVAREGGEPARARGLLAAVHGSSQMTMEDFDQASLILHQAVPEETQVVIGVISDEEAGATVKVSLMVVN